LDGTGIVYNPHVKGIHVFWCGNDCTQKIPLTTKLGGAIGRYHFGRRFEIYVLHLFPKWTTCDPTTCTNSCYLAGGRGGLGGLGMACYTDRGAVGGLGAGCKALGATDHGEQGDRGAPGSDGTSKLKTELFIIIKNK